MNGLYIAVFLLLTSTFRQFRSTQATQSGQVQENPEKSEKNKMSEEEGDDAWWDPYPNRPGCPEQCECRSKVMVCLGTIPDVIPVSEEDVLLRDIPWAELENQKRFCLSNWSNVKNLEIAFKREYNYIVRGVFLKNEIDCLEQLQRLEFRYAEIRFSKATFSDLNNLKTMDLSECNFNISNLQDILSLPENLPSLSSLILKGAYKYHPHLEFNQSWIESLSLRPIQYLDVSAQTLEFYFHSIRKLCNTLKALIMVDSDIIVTSSELEHCYSLDLVDISGSNLLQISFKLHDQSSNIIGCVNRSVPLAKGLGFRLPKTVHAKSMFSKPMYFTSDRCEILNCIVHLDHSCTEELVFTRNRLPEFEFIFAIQCLKYIDLSLNSIQTMNPGAIKFLANLEKIDLSHNQFGSVHSNETNLGTLFQYNNKLSFFDLTGNYLSTLPYDTFALNPMLRYINLSHNSFSQIHFKISHLARLEILDLRNNAIKFLDANSRNEVDELYRKQIEARVTLNGSTALQILLDGNPFLCECYLYEFLLWFDASPFLETTKQNSHCYAAEQKVLMYTSALAAAEQDCQKHILTPMYFQYLYIKSFNYIQQNARTLSTTAGILIISSIILFVHKYHRKTMHRRFFISKPIRNINESKRGPPGSFLQLEDRRSLVAHHELVLEMSRSVGKLSGFGITGTCFRVGERYIMTARHVINDIINEGLKLSAHGSRYAPSVVLENDNVYVEFGYLTNTSVTEKVYFTSNVMFENEKLDVAIVELQESEGQTLPVPLTVSPNTLTGTRPRFTFVGHPGGEFKQLNPVDGFVEVDNYQKETASTWSNIVAKTDGYEGIDNPGRILFHCSFQKGGSGSPGIAVVGNTPVVVTVLLHGYPDWFYDLNFDKRIKDTVHNQQRIEQGVLMESLHQLLLAEAPDICKDIFRTNVGTPMDVE